MYEVAVLLEIIDHLVSNSRILFLLGKTNRSPVSTYRTACSKIQYRMKGIFTTTVDFGVVGLDAAIVCCYLYHIILTHIRQYP